MQEPALRECSALPSISCSGVDLIGAWSEPRKASVCDLRSSMAEGLPPASLRLQACQPLDIADCYSVRDWQHDLARDRRCKPFV
jgi:hypothetical protein